MGCDIHIFAEIRNKQTNHWKKVGDHIFLLVNLIKNIVNYSPTTLAICGIRFFN